MIFSGHFLSGLLNTSSKAHTCNPLTLGRLRQEDQQSTNSQHRGDIESNQSHYPSQVPGGTWDSSTSSCAWQYTLIPSTQEEGRSLLILGQSCLHTVSSWPATTPQWDRVSRKKAAGVAQFFDNYQVSLQFTDEQVRYLCLFQNQHYTATTTLFSDKFLCYELLYSLPRTLKHESEVSTWECEAGG